MDVLTGRQFPGDPIKFLLYSGLCSTVFRFLRLRRSRLTGACRSFPGAVDRQARKQSLAALTPRCLREAGSGC